MTAVTHWPAWGCVCALGGSLRAGIFHEAGDFSTEAQPLLFALDGRINTAAAAPAWRGVVWHAWSLPVGVAGGG